MRFRPQAPKDTATENDPETPGAAAEDIAVEEAQDDESPAEEVGGPGRISRIAALVLTGLACALLLFALIGPNQIERFMTPEAYLRIPLVGLLGVALILVLPPRARRVAAVLGGAVLGLQAILKILDIGFHATLDRPFDPLLDWYSLGAAVDFLTSLFGRPGAIACVVGVVAVAVAVLVLMALSAARMTRILVAHRRVSAGAAAVLAVAWITCAALGAQLVPGLPVAEGNYGRLLQARAGVQDKDTFAREVKDDAFASTPPDQMLTGLRGNDVMLTFVESYGRIATEDRGTQAFLDAGTRQLGKAGYSARTGFLTSSTFGGNSWLAHTTLLSGLWINNQQRYNTLVTTDRVTITSAFQRAKWRTVGIEPGVTQRWPQAGFYGFDRIYPASALGYKGPKLSWSTMPDQYALSVFHRSERAKPGHAPVMAEVELTSSHDPWEPVPTLLDWNDVGDGSVFAPLGKRSEDPGIVLHNTPKVRSAYQRSIEYSINTLISYVQTYGGDNLVLVFLGDHQPPIVTPRTATHDVTITIVAHDPNVLNRISGWGWTPGLKPSPKAPVWPMDTFRDRFLTAFGSQKRP